MQRLSRSLTSLPMGPVPGPVSDETNESWAQAELASYFKQHPEKLSGQLDRIMDKLRASQGDMQDFIVELDRMIDALNADIDHERRDVVGRSRLMRDFPDVTNEFLHFFLDGIMEAMEEEQAGGGPARASTGSSSGAGVAGAAASGRTSGLLGVAGAMRARSASGGSAGKERFSTVPKRVPS